MSARILVVCRRSACRRIEIELPTRIGIGEALKILCLCGSEMRRVYSEPVFRELSETKVGLRFGDSLLMKTQVKTAGPGMNFDSRGCHRAAINPDTGRNFS